MITAHGYGFLCVGEERPHAVVRPVAVPDVISGDGYITYMSTGYQAICPQVFRICPLFNPIMSAIYTQSCPLFITPSGCANLR
jgi:hypothetical protein